MKLQTLDSTHTAAACTATTRGSDCTRATRSGGDFDVIHAA